MVDSLGYISENLLSSSCWGHH